ncbi:MAG: hypothetical protein FWB97_11155 [Oscillospiraceae bacterium]|nr:hypothetical protein [Oscillospiraceae bacterium]
MPSFTVGMLVKEVRMRKRWSVSRLQEERERHIRAFGNTKKTIERIDNLVHNPNPATTEPVMESLGVPMDRFFYPYLEYDPYVFKLRNRLLCALEAAEDESDKEALEYAEALLGKLLEKHGRAEGFMRQFMLGCEARILVQSGKNTLEAVKLALDGLSCTYPEFDVRHFEGEILLPEEIDLVHTIALADAKQGESQAASDLLERMISGIEKLPKDDVEKEKKLPKVLLSLANLHIRAGLYERGLGLCSEGLPMSVERSRGRYAPAFAYNKALCLLRLGKKGECRSLLQQAYFGYNLMNMKKHQERVLKDAEGIFGVTFCTYGAESLPQESPAQPPEEKGECGMEACDSVGSLLRQFRLKAGLPQKELYQGVCTSSNYSKIEKGDIQANVYFLEHFMQRLGRDIDLYLHTFISLETFEEKQMRDKVRVLLSSWRYDEARALLSELERRKDYNSGVNLQTVLDAKASILSEEKGCCQECVNIIIKALRITLPQFDERNISGYRLSHNEISLVNKLAIHYAETGCTPKALRIYEELRESMNSSYIDESEKCRMYPTILYNYSKYLGKMERYKEALGVVREGEAISVQLGRISLLPGFAANKAYNLEGLGQKEESVLFFAQAHYGSGLVGKSQAATGNYVKERFGIGFD